MKKGDSGMIYRFDATICGNNNVTEDLQGLVWGKTMGQAAANLERELEQDMHLVSVKLEIWTGTSHGVLLLTKEGLDDLEGSYS